MEEWCEQVFFIPGETKPDSAGIILSCGVHGNETGPITTCKSLLDEILSGRVRPARHLLLIFANPRAIDAGRRYLDFNLNRLFGNAMEGGIEAERARELERACHQLQQHCGHIHWHLDLHSTIKPSCIERFALTPVTHQEYRYHWQPALQQAGFGGLVYQTRRASTFSQYTLDQFGADSFTLECGSLQTQSAAGNATLLRWLIELVSDPTAPSQAQGDVPHNHASPLPEFQVAEEIMRRSEWFRFLIAEQEPNFSEHQQGTLIYTDDNGPVAARENCYTLFLNSRVETGQRAGLLLKRLQ